MVIGQAEKVRENRLQEAAKRQGYRLMKSRRRDRRAIGYGGYMIIDPITNGIVAGDVPHEFSLDLDHVYRWLVEGQIRRDLARDGWRHPLALYRRDPTLARRDAEVVTRLANALLSPATPAQSGGSRHAFQHGL